VCVWVVENDADVCLKSFAYYLLLTCVNAVGVFAFYHRQKKMNPAFYCLFSYSFVG
jgi:hypothetical protein